MQERQRIERRELLAEKGKGNETTKYDNTFLILSCQAMATLRYKRDLERGWIICFSSVFLSEQQSQLEVVLHRNKY